MDGPENSISPIQLYERLGTARAPIVLDVRRAADFALADRMIVSAAHRAPEEVARWAKDVAGQPVVVYCVHGHQVSQGAAAARKSTGAEASNGPPLDHLSS